MKAGAFDNWFSRIVGDTGAQFQATHKLDYAVHGTTGMPLWADLFRYLLEHFEHIRWARTAFVLVDNRDLTAPNAPVVAGPLARGGGLVEKSDYVWPCQGAERPYIFIPIDCIGRQSGLHRVHPTWAGTFVLAALTLVFPGTHFVLLDSDCIPVTLLEVADLWKEASLTRQHTSGCPPVAKKGSPANRNESTESAPTASKIGEAGGPVPHMGQGILLVTEHNAEINAGFIVVFASCHRPPLDNENLATELMSLINSKTSLAARPRPSRFRFELRRDGEYALVPHQPMLLQTIPACLNRLDQLGPF